MSHKKFFEDVLANLDPNDPTHAEARRHAERWLELDPRFHALGAQLKELLERDTVSMPVVDALLAERQEIWDEIKQLAGRAKQLALGHHLMPRRPQ